jgi:hypothetical protein
LVFEFGVMSLEFGVKDWVITDASEIYRSRLKSTGRSADMRTEFASELGPGLIRRAMLAVALIQTL